ncbi:MAG: gamma-glutamylcyclotransferase [Rhodospirillales bacterium]|nr:gamma-glutamylcyclotransferase [Rhodospirillales bacterium]
MIINTVGPFPELSDEWRRASLESFVADILPKDDIWLFAYGSLIWNPCFVHDRSCPGLLLGYRRRFSIWTAHARGTPERPGLGLALEPGDGSCGGMLFRIDPGHRDAGLWAIWQREMATGIYRAEWHPVQTESGPVRAICFVADRSHPQYAGAFSADEAAHIIAQASGKFGSCADYLKDTVTALADMGHGDPELDALLTLVTDRLSGDA